MASTTTLYQNMSDELTKERTDLVSGLVSATCDGSQVMVNGQPTTVRPIWSEAIGQAAAQGSKVKFIAAVEAGFKQRIDDKGTGIDLPAIFTAIQLPLDDLVAKALLGYQQQKQSASSIPGYMGFLRNKQQNSGQTAEPAPAAPSASPTPVAASPVAVAPQPPVPPAVPSNTGGSAVQSVAEPAAPAAEPKTPTPKP